MATPISIITEVLDFEIEVQCQSDVLSESLVIMVNSTTYNIPQPSLISKFNVTINQTGYDISVQCIWSANGGMIMDETIVNGKVCFYSYRFNGSIAAPLAPILSVMENPTSIAVNWITISDANGYVVYVNDAAYIVTGGDSANYTVDGLVPGTDYSITVRAYQDILGPATTVYATTNNGK